MKRLLTILFLLVFIITPSFAANKPDNDIIVIYTNDVHCGVDNNLGYAGLAYYRDEMKKLTPYVTLVDAGDAVQGGTIGTISNGRYIIEIMNALKYDLAVPGNHEFDYGMEQFNYFAKNLSCGYISCNFKDAVTGQLVLKPYKIISYGGVKVAFVGACTPETITAATAVVFKDSNGNYIYDVDNESSGEKLINSIQKAVDDARNNGADYVIVVGHLGEYGDTVKNWSAPFIISKTKGIDALIDGHSHEVTPNLKIKNLDGKEIPITQTGTKLTHIGKLTINKNGDISTELIDKVESKDEKITALIDEFKARYEDTIKQPIGYTSFDLTVTDDNGNRIVRIQETNFGDLVTDAFLFEAEKFGGAEIAMITAGSIRVNIKSGILTYNDALTVMPFGNTVDIYEIPGQTILDELEHGVRKLPDLSGGFLQVSGLSYEVDASKESPVIVDDKGFLIKISGDIKDRRVRNVLVNNEPIDPERIYRLVSTNYLVSQNGDGHIFSGKKTILLDMAVDADALSHYIKSLGVIPEKYRNPQGRIKIH